MDGYNKPYTSGVHHRKKQKFRGNQFTRAKNLGTDTTTPTASTSTASFRKLESSDIRRRSLDKVDRNWTGYILMDYDLMISHLEESCRCKCGGKLQFIQENKGGLATVITQTCIGDCKESSSFNNSSKIGPKKNVWEINRRSTISARATGIGHRTLHKFCALMELPAPVQAPTFYKTIKNIHESAGALAEQSMNDGARQEEEKNNSTDVEVSGDGTWQRRGHQSLNGVSTLIGMRSGKVIDFEVLSKACIACAQYSGDRESEEFEQWYFAHVQECEANHLGSPSKMESDGMLAMYLRSEEKRGLRYVTYVGDGDSSTFRTLADADPYPGINLLKKEDIGHIEKRVKYHLTALKTRMKGRKLSDGKGLDGKKRLTKETILKIQKYYGKGIRENCTSVPEMTRAVWAIYHHLKSTNESHDHSYCPEGSESWCKYQKAKATEKEYNHDNKLIDPICVEACYPVFQELSSPTLLERCLGAYSQNQNQSFNNVIWPYCPKAKFCGRRVVEIATQLAVLDFNDGQRSKFLLYDSLELKVGEKNGSLGNCNR